MSATPKRLAHQAVVDAVADLYIDLCHRLPGDVPAAIQAAIETEDSPTGRTLLNLLLDNAQLAGERMIPLCQDTGVAVLFVDQGHRLFIAPPDDRPDATLLDAIHDGVARGYAQGYLRMSMVDDPIDRRINTRTNTPAVIHHRFVPGETLTLAAMAKGAGCENKSKAAMLIPAQGRQGVLDFVVGAAATAGADA